MADNQDVILARLDERTSKLIEQVESLHTEHKELGQKVSDLPLAMLERGKEHFAPRSRYVIVERAVFGFIAAIIVGLVGFGFKAALPDRVVTRAISMEVAEPEPEKTELRVLYGAEKPSQGS